jgi:hypothetical protein
MPDRKAKLAEIARLHDEWVAAQLETAPFDPDSRPDSKDYNLWYVDMASENEEEFQAAAQKVIHPDDKEEF